MIIIAHPITNPSPYIFYTLSGRIGCAFASCDGGTGTIPGQDADLWRSFARTSDAQGVLPCKGWG